MSITAGDLAATLTDGRAAFLVIATDEVLVTRADPTAPLPPLNPDGTRPPRTQKTVYQGPARIQVRSDVNSNVVDVSIGGQSVENSYQTATVQLPIEAPAGSTGSTADVRVDDTVKMVTAVHDPELDDRLWQVRALGNKSHATSRRIRVTEAVA